MKYFIIFLLGAVACFFLIKGCMVPSVKTVTQTTYIKSWDTAYQPVLNPYKVVQEPVYVYKDRAGKHDTEYLVRPADVDTAAILKDFFAQVLYNDTMLVKYGVVIIKDTISQNRIAGRSVMERFEIPTVTTIVTKTLPPSRELYLGGIIGYQVGVGALYKDRKDQLFGASMSLTQHGTLLGLSYYRKISIHL